MQVDNQVDAMLKALGFKFWKVHPSQAVGFKYQLIAPLQQGGEAQGEPEVHGALSFNLCVQMCALVITLFEATF